MGTIKLRQSLPGIAGLFPPNMQSVEDSFGTRCIPSPAPGANGTRGFTVRRTVRRALLASRRQTPGFRFPASGHCLCGVCTFFPPVSVRGGGGFPGSGCSGFLPQCPKTGGLRWNKNRKRWKISALVGQRLRRENGANVWSLDVPFVRASSKGLLRFSNISCFCSRLQHPQDFIFYLRVRVDWPF